MEPTLAHATTSRRILTTAVPTAERERYTHTHKLFFYYPLTSTTKLHEMQQTFQLTASLTPPSYNKKKHLIFIFQL